MMWLVMILDGLFLCHIYELQIPTSQTKCLSTSACVVVKLPNLNVRQGCISPTVHSLHVKEQCV